MNAWILIAAWTTVSVPVALALGVVLGGRQAASTGPRPALVRPARRPVNG